MVLAIARIHLSSSFIIICKKKLFVGNIVFMWLRNRQEVPIGHSKADIS